MGMRTRTGNSPSSFNVVGKEKYIGMEVESEWLKKDGFQDFMEHIGPSFEGAVLDRIENNKGYIKGNVKWSTFTESVDNRECVIKYTVNGKTQSLARWAEESGINYHTLYNRVVVFSMPIEKALNYVKGGGLTVEAFGKIQTISEWSKETGLSFACIHHRIFKLNLDPEYALSKPSRFKK